jgi:hypothetical protein
MVYDLANGFPKAPRPSAATLRATGLLADMVLPSSCSSQLRASCELRLQIKLAAVSDKKLVPVARCFQ